MADITGAHADSMTEKIMDAFGDEQSAVPPEKPLQARVRQIIRDWTGV